MLESLNSTISDDLNNWQNCFDVVNLRKSFLCCRRVIVMFGMSLKNGAVCFTILSFLKILFKVLLLLNAVILVGHSLKNVKKFTIFLRCKFHCFVLIFIVNFILPFVVVIMEITY